MAAIQTRRFNFVRTLTARESIEAWRAKRKSIREDFEATQQAAVNALSGALSNNITAAGDLAAKAALKRVQTEINKKIEELRAAKDENIIPPSRNSVFSVTSQTTLDGGSRIDLDANTLTLPNGTVVDLTTGLKKVDVIA